MISPIPVSLLPLDATDEDVLYIADANMNVVFVNTAWRSFAGCNNGSSILGEGWNSHLLANFSGSERLRWQAIYQALMTGQIHTHEENFICPSPLERRTYRLRIQRYADAAGKTTYLSHHAARVDRRGEASVLGKRLRALDADAELTAETYKRLVLERPVRSARVATAQLFASLEEVGGDLLWHRNWAQGGMDLLIADVMGHGLDAARLAAKIALLLEAQAAESMSVAENVAHLNQALVDLARRDGQEGPLFATGLYLRIDSAMQSLVLCSFGHIGPIFSIAGYIDVTPGLPVGVVDNHVAGPWPERTLRFADHGQRFIIFTDGLSEQFNRDGEMFGLAGVERAFRRAIDWPLPQMVEAIRSEVEAFRGDALVKDDQALLAIDV